MNINYIKVGHYGHGGNLPTLLHSGKWIPYPFIATYDSELWSMTGNSAVGP